METVNVVRELLRGRLPFPEQLSRRRIEANHEAVPLLHGAHEDLPLGDRRCGVNGIADPDPPPDVSSSGQVNRAVRPLFPWHKGLGQALFRRNHVLRIRPRPLRPVASPQGERRPGQENDAGKHGGGTAHAKKIPTVSEGRYPFCLLGSRRGKGVAAAWFVLFHDQVVRSHRADKRKPGDGAAPIAYCHLEIVRLPTRRRSLRGRRLKERLVG